VIDYVLLGALSTELPTVTVSCPVIFITLDLFVSTEQAVIWYQTLDINCFSVRIQVFGAKFDKCLIISGDYMEVWCVSSATIWHVYSFYSFGLMLWHILPNLPQIDLWNVNKFDSLLT
jgi:hypothetical protein